MRSKADENLRAADSLWQARRFSAAANRLYYAVYHAAWHRFQALGLGFGALPQPTKLKQKEVADARYLHSTVELYARRLRNIDRDRLLIKALRDMRATADYTDLPVEPARFEARWAEAQGLVEELTR